MGILIEDKYNKWKDQCRCRFETVKKNEERINEELINLYGLQAEESHNVDDNDVTIYQANLSNDIVNLISYSV